MLIVYHLSLIHILIGGKFLLHCSQQQPILPSMDRSVTPVDKHLDAIHCLSDRTGITKGFFLKVDEHIKLADLTTVPIAIPMIAGPATITAAVTFPVQYGREITIIAILIALVVNLFCMLQARRIGNFLIKYNFMNPLIRIIGLIVATIGLQMIFDGITLFIKTLTV